MTISEQLRYEEIFDIKDNLKIKATRVLLDEEILNKKMIPIRNDAFYSIANSISREPLELPKLYVALRFLTGPGDLHYDDYKGSYSFHFMLKVHTLFKTESLDTLLTQRLETELMTIGEQLRQEITYRLKSQV